MKTPLEDVVSQFLALGAELMAATDLVGRDQLLQLMGFFRNTPVEEADDDSPDDTIELACGEDYPVDASTPLDARNLGDEDYDFVDVGELCLTVERQIFPSLVDGADPDDHIVTLTVYVSFGPLEGDVDDTAIQIEDLESDGADYDQFVSQPMVSNLLERTPVRVSVLIEGGG